MLQAWADKLQRSLAKGGVERVRHAWAPKAFRLYLEEGQKRLLVIYFFRRMKRQLGKTNPFFKTREKEEVLLLKRLSCLQADL